EDEYEDDEDEYEDDEDEYEDDEDEYEDDEDEYEDDEDDFVHKGKTRAVVGKISITDEDIEKIVSRISALAPHQTPQKSGKPPKEVINERAYNHSLEILKVLIPLSSLDKKKPFPDYMIWIYESIAARLFDIYVKDRPEKRKPPEAPKGAAALVDEFISKKGK
ncbi:MAG TPA: hypothetical protein PL110_12195, partial [Candidatus Eremiobacteraeota bacterium]|nr:hypothetical protein [Candidatus Eremiobacteraeota bacterium]